MPPEPDARTLDLLHEAALNPALWPEALSAAAERLDCSAILFGVHALAPAPGADPSRFATAAGLTPDALVRFRDRYVAPETNVLVRTLDRLADGVPVPRAALQDTASYRASRIYREILRPAGCEAAVLGCARLDAGLAAPVSFLRTPRQGEFAGADLQRIQAFMAHLRRAARSFARLHLQGAAAGPRAGCRIDPGYGLTPRETALALALVETGQLALAARALGMRPVTARNHLKRIFSKTDTRGQVDLVCRLLAAPRPAPAGSAARPGPPGALRD